ncbi:MAG: hypothetical protein Q4F72_09655, partial [Desulfovibrionaceae bacterium]|nr:hypothetical protein [Desulfovibrionaceae bacterium]
LKSLFTGREAGTARQLPARASMRGLTGLTGHGGWRSRRGRGSGTVRLKSLFTGREAGTARQLPAWAFM